MCTHLAISAQRYLSLHAFSYLCVVFPIRFQFSKPGFQVAVKKNKENPFFSGFEMNAILSDKTQYHCEITTICPSAIY